MFGLQICLRRLRQRLTNGPWRYDSWMHLYRGASWSAGATHKSRDSSDERAWPNACDVLVVGGGAVGSSVAYHLKERAREDLSVIVVEQDSTYKTASTVLSLGNIREQFSVAENIQLSMYSRRFLRQVPELLSVEGSDPVDVQFTPQGYLFVTHEEGLKQMQENFKLQTSLGAKVEWLWSRQLQQRFPWLRLGKVVAGIIGDYGNEGFFDPWALLMGLRRKAEWLGARYLDGRVTDLIHRQQATPATGHTPPRILTTAQITVRSGEKRDIQFSTLVVAAGAWSGALGRMAGLGCGTGFLATPIPVEPRKRNIFCVHAPHGPWKDCPIFNDYTGLYFRPDRSGQLYIIGMSPSEDKEPPADDLQVDYQFFDTDMWPILAERVPAFENLKVRSAWAGFYDYNTLDQNLIVGFHPVYKNMCLATGFSGHGIQQSPAVGRAVMEYILDGKSHSINLERFGFDRILANQPIKEMMVM
ncbi:FAD-dependent oxidoreductase domain-containing protein 1-like [Panulirus ornatus]|uniref:FAD-dependent oxidoreductase domain-containing protein 1-like n=1 Tax=Panulirus ornatus TaxID=150431 RepID=UPI003A89BA58